ncbi:MAG: hypothetical protein U0514_02100 [Candidatus Andersenbacteria bacterium]
MRHPGIAATIVDVESLRKANAEFTTRMPPAATASPVSSKAIIYREHDARVINVAPVKLTPTDATKKSE